MRILKHLAILFVGISTVLTAFSLLMPGEVMTSRWVITGPDRDAALRELRDLRGWPRWNLLLDGARDLKVSMPASEVDTGGTIEWTDAKGRASRFVVVENTENGLVTTLKIGDDRPLQTGFSVEKRRTDSVQVVWFLIEKLRWYPWERFYGMMASDMKGPLMQESLLRFKGELDRKKGD